MSLENISAMSDMLGLLWR